VTIIDIFHEMKTSEEIVLGKYYKYVGGKEYLTKITEHEAVVRKLKDLATYKAYHVNKNWKKAALIKI